MGRICRSVPWSRLLLPAIFVLGSLAQGGESTKARQRIDRFVATEYRHHPDRPALAMRYYELWRKLPPHLAEAGLERIESATRSTLGVMDSVDPSRGRMGENPVHDGLVVPVAFYQRLYVLAEQSVSSQLRAAAAHKGVLGPAVQRTFDGQVDRILDEAERLLEARITGEGGRRLVEERIDARRAAFKSLLSDPWWARRALTEAELSETLAAVAAAAAQCASLRVDEYDPGAARHHPLVLALAAWETGDPVASRLSAAMRGVDGTLASAARIYQTLKPEQYRLSAEQGRVWREASTWLSGTIRRERKALDVVARPPAEQLGLRLYARRQDLRVAAANARAALRR